MKFFVFVVVFAVCFVLFAFCRIITGGKVDNTYATASAAISAGIALGIACAI
jgi:hypothetical protein